MSADKSVREARQARLDVLGPQVSVGPVVALRERWHYGQYTQPGDLVHPPGVAAPGTEYSVPMNGSVRVMLGVWIPIGSEGDRSVTVQVSAFRSTAATPRLTLSGCCRLRRKAHLLLFRVQSCTWSRTRKSAWALGKGGRWMSGGRSALMHLCRCR